MNRNKFRYWTLLLINEYNHSKIFISEKNRYYIKRDNKSIHLQILMNSKILENLITKLMSLTQEIIITKFISLVL